MSQFPKAGRLLYSVWAAPEAALAVDTVIFIAPFDCSILAAQECHSVIGSDGGAVTVMLTKDVPADAPGAGTNLLTAGFNLKAAIDTAQDAVFATTAGLRNLAKGDRVSVDFAGTQTAVAGLVIGLTLGYNPE